jgi:RNA polymerase sigma-70 factor (ECF subfamily)
MERAMAGEVTGSRTTEMPGPGPGPGPGPRAAATSDQGEWRHAFEAHAGELQRFASKTLGDRALAEEAVQETFLRAWRARERFDPNKGALRTWLFAIERHVIIDLARARARRAVRSAEPVSGDRAGPVDQAAQVLDAWQVGVAIGRLNPEHRQVLVETYYGGRTSAELARTWAIPEGTVRSRLFYALRNLRLQLEELGWEP